MRLRLVLALLAVGLVAGATQATPQAPPLAGLDRYIELSLQDWGIPGAAIAVIKGDSVIHARGFGVRRLGDTARVTPETIFAIGSITKSFTVAALGLLADEGKRPSGSRGSPWRTPG